MRPLFFTVLLLFAALPGMAKPSFHRPAVEDAVRHFHLNEAMSMAWKDPDSLVKVYYIPRILLIKYAATIERKYIEPFHLSVEKGIEIAESLPEDQVERGVLLSELHLLSGLMHLTRRDYFAAAKGKSRTCARHIVHSQDAIFSMLFLIAVFPTIWLT